MEQLKILITPIHQIIKWIDDGEFFKKPVEWFYIVCGAISAILSLGCLYFVIENNMFLSSWAEGWNYFVGVVTLILFSIGLILSAIYSFYYWWNRSKQISTIVGRNQKITAIPVVGNFIQTTFEVLGMQVLLIGCYLATLLFVATLLRWGFGDFQGFIIGLCAWIIGILVCCFTSYLLVIIGHFVGEKCRVWAIVGNNLDGIKKTLKSIAED